MASAYAVEQLHSLHLFWIEALPQIITHAVVKCHGGECLQRLQPHFLQVADIAYRYGAGKTLDQVSHGIPYVVEGVGLQLGFTAIGIAFQPLHELQQPLLHKVFHVDEALNLLVATLTYGVEQFLCQFDNPWSCQADQSLHSYFVTTQC